MSEKKFFTVCFCQDFFFFFLAMSDTEPVETGLCKQKAIYLLIYPKSPGQMTSSIQGAPMM